MFRATLRGMMARKARLVLTSLAVMLAALFVSAAMVLTSSLSDATDNLLTDAFEDVEVVIEPSDIDYTGPQGGIPPSLPSELIDEVEQIANVDEAQGSIEGFVQALDANDNLVGTFAPNMGLLWMEDDPSLELQEGRGPDSDNEVAVSTLFEDTAGLGVGDSVTVYTPTTERTDYDIVGVYGWAGGRDSMAGETSMSFTAEEAQRLVMDGEDEYNSIYVRAVDGVSETQLRDDIQEALSHHDNLEIMTGEEASEAISEELGEFTDIMGWVFLGFGLIAVFVSIFLIYNTFNIVVAQRLKELALTRALGASRKQVRRSVLLEAFVVGVIASTLGLILGIFSGYGLSVLMSNFAIGGIEVPFGVPLSAVLWAFGVGIGVTLLSALIPAQKASRVAPVAAMRDAATPNKSIKAPTIAGVIITGLGLALAFLGLRGDLGDANVAGTFGGVFLLFLGVTFLTPALSKPIVGVLGRIMAWGMPGKLGRQNASRNPRRTAITASAIMIGVALVTAIGTVLSSISASTAEYFEDNVDAELIISGVQTGPITPTFNSSKVDEIANVSDVSAVADSYMDFVDIEKDTDLEGTAQFQTVMASQNIVEYFGAVDSDVSGSTLSDLGEREILVNEGTAERFSIDEGDTFSMQLPRGEEHEFTVKEVIADFDLTNGFWVSDALIDELANPNPYLAFITLNDAADIDAAQTEVEAVIDDEPEVSVSNQQQFIEEQTAFLDFILIAIQVLLALALVIAVIGVVNTLVLSVLERTRELGLLRAVGMTRGQAARMITIESITIAVFGALMGLGVGVGLGWLIFEGMDVGALDTFAVPTGLMITYLIAAIIVGFLAAIAPAVRAAKLDVLDAIAYE